MKAMYVCITVILCVKVDEKSLLNLNWLKKLPEEHVGIFAGGQIHPEESRQQKPEDLREEEDVLRHPDLLILTNKTVD